jgi:hypothetical protein
MNRYCLLKTALLWMILVVLLMFPEEAGAINRVKIAAVTGGASYFGIDITAKPQQITDQVISKWQEKLKPVMVHNPDLVLLPEACDLPTFRWSKDEKFLYFKARGNQVLGFFASVAKQNRCYIAFGTYIERGDGRWNDSVVLVDRNGKVCGVYNKNFPTDEEMDEGFVPSDQVELLECDFGKVAAVICFDLNFDELRERIANLNPDVLLFSSMYHGSDFVQNYWAYSCRSFLAGAQFNYNVPSEIRNPVGRVVASSTNYTDFAVAEINLDFALVHLGGNKGKLGMLKEKYGDRVTIEDPGKLAVVMVSSDHPSKSAEEMLKEFDIEPLGHMFERSRKMRSCQVGGE